jgi:hypothetical protein
MTLYRTKVGRLIKDKSGNMWEKAAEEDPRYLPGGTEKPYEKSQYNLCIDQDQNWALSEKKFRKDTGFRPLVQWRAGMHAPRCGRHHHKNHIMVFIFMKIR